MLYDSPVKYGDWAVRTAENGESLRRFFAVLSWAVILAGGIITGFGCWFLLGYGGPIAWFLAAIWSLVCILFTALAWGLVALAGLVADHIGNSWWARVRPETVLDIAPDDDLPTVLL